LRPIRRVDTPCTFEKGPAVGEEAAMAWQWSDDLARLVIENDAVPREQLGEWLTNPTAHRCDGDPLDFARALFGLDAPEIDDAGVASVA
jgi:hypothetical protein